MFCKISRLVALTALIGAAAMAYQSRDDMKRYLRIRQM